MIEYFGWIYSDLMDVVDKFVCFWISLCPSGNIVVRKLINQDKTLLN